MSETTTQNPNRSLRSGATEAEIKTAIQCQLKPRLVPGHASQPTLGKRGKNHMPVGRPLGTTTGFPIFLAICYVFQQNEKAPQNRKLTDAAITEWLVKEFPGRKSAYWKRVQEMRRYYNRGRYTRDIPPKVQSHRYDSGGATIDPAYGQSSAA